MHCNLFSDTRRIALDDALENLSILLPYLSLLSGETDVLLDSLCQAERRLALSCAAVKSFLVLFDESVKDIFKIFCIAVSIESKSWKGRDGLTEKTSLKP